MGVWMAHPNLFKAVRVEEYEPGQFKREIVNRPTADLPDGEVLVRVLYSSLNYKDALSASGNRGVTRNYPHTPGIDAAGVVEESSCSEWEEGDRVFSVSMGEVGVNSPGGFGQYIRVPANWLIRLPEGLSLRESMAYGTAGFTSALSVERLQAEGVKPENGEVLVTGATGGVGSIAVMILAKLGYAVTAATGKQDEAGFLKEIGARKVIPREEINDTSGKALLHGRWAGVVDTIGGGFLATAVRACLPGGVVTACGNAASADLPLTVYPFILRGVTLAGIDATQPSLEEREQIWRKLAREWKPAALEKRVREVTLDEVDGEIEKMLQGKNTGRVIINLG